MYIVIAPFIDIEDGDKIYSTGDVYTGKKTKKRLEVLTTSNNAYGYPFVVLEKDDADGDTESSQE